jgi:hypothetical protein
MANNKISPSGWVAYLTTLTLSSLYTENGTMINEREAVCGMRIDRGN